MKRGDVVIVMRAQENSRGDKIPYAAVVEIIVANRKREKATIRYNCICCGSYVTISCVPFSELSK